MVKLTMASDSASDKHKPSDSAERRTGIRHWHGRQFNDAGTGLSGGHQTFGGLRQRLCHRRRRLLSRLCYRYLKPSPLLMVNLHGLYSFIESSM